MVGQRDYIGAATITKMPTTHYRLSPKKGPTVNYWLDSKNRIVRMKWESNDGEHDTMDFYDFGASIPKITAPANAKHACA